MKFVTDVEKQTEEMNGGCCCGYNYPVPGDCTIDANRLVQFFL